MAMQDLSTIRKRDGAFYWGLFQHDNKENVYIKRFLVDSWVEHLRQHERMKVADRSSRICLGISYDEKPPNVSHFIAGPFQTIVREGVMMTTIFRELSRQNNYIEFSIDS
jgi:hypothetical protein